MEAVNHPSHYNTGKIEVIDFIEDQNLNFNTGNAVKYIARAGKKNPEKEKEDIEKAIWYLQRELNKFKTQQPDKKLDRSSGVLIGAFYESRTGVIAEVTNIIWEKCEAIVVYDLKQPSGSVKTEGERMKAETFKQVYPARIN